MSSYILRGCLGFSLIMMFVCHGNAVLPECGGSDFICNQWERKEMNTDVYVSRYCNMGPKANAGRISL